MKITIITLFPKMISGFFEESIVKKAQEKKLIEIEIVNLRDFSVDDYGSVDDRPYGGGAGMILKVDVIHKALQRVIPSDRNDKTKTIITSPKGKIFNQGKAVEYSKLDHLVIIAGHYESVDERVMDFVDEEISLGDFILTGGEIAASAVTDSVVRLLPGVLKKEEATVKESFFSVSIKHLIEVVEKNDELLKLQNKGIKEIKLLEYPQYTRPEDFMGKKVPEILLSGDHKKIEEWKLIKAFEETLKKRKDLLKKARIRYKSSCY